MLMYALLNVNQMKLSSVVDSIRGVCGESVNKLHPVYGEFDVLLKLKGVNRDSLTSLLNKIRDLDGVMSVKTYMVAHKTKESDVLPGY